MDEHRLILPISLKEITPSEPVFVCPRIYKVYLLFLCALFGFGPGEHRPFAKYSICAILIPLIVVGDYALYGMCMTDFT